MTFVDLEDRAVELGRMSLSARHTLELVDGRRLLLLGDRGWSISLNELLARHVPDADSSQDDQPDISAVTSADAIQEMARVVVGPDEPADGQSLEAMEADHWAHLSGILRQQGAAVDALDLRQLPHDVVLGERLLAVISHDPGDAVSS